MFDLDPKTEDLARRVIGAAIEVHRTLGPGFLEKVYQRSLSVELDHEGIEHRVESPVKILYRGVDVGDGRADILITDHLIVELKTVEAIADIHRAQVLPYLKATGLRLGLLMNFNTTVLKDGIQRIIH
ncbi:GxxExxY protein [Phycisphaeraceae bacterium D3-23]